jgi:hypothetical protein
MKKILKGVCMIAVIALAFTSCKKTDEKVGMRITGSTQNPVEESLDEERSYIVYHTPTSNKFNTYFEVGDQVMFYNLNETDPTQTNYGIYTADDEGQITEFTYSSGTIINHNPTETHLYAFYPAEIVNNAKLWDLAHGNEVMFEITDHQVYREKDGMAILPKGTWCQASKDIVAANVDEQHFEFNNIMGALRLKLTSPSGKKIESIVYEDNTFDVTGRTHVDIDKVDPIMLTNLLNHFGDPAYATTLNNYIHEAGYYTDPTQAGIKGKTITLDCGEGVQLGSTVKDFFIVLRPAAMYNGFKLTFNIVGEAPIEYTYNGTASGQGLMIKPNGIKKLTLNIDTI